MRNDHTALVNDTLVELGLHPELGKFWKQVTGVFRGFEDPSKIIRCGMPGAHDITGTLWDGRRAEIDAKTGKARLNKNQKIFRGVMQPYGVMCLTVRQKDEAVEVLLTMKKMKNE